LLETKKIHTTLHTHFSVSPAPFSNLTAQLSLTHLDLLTTDNMRPKAPCGVLYVFVCFLLRIQECSAFCPRPQRRQIAATSLSAESDDDDNKFGFGQRIDSLKCLVTGAVAGSFALAPFAFIHDILLLEAVSPIQTNTLAQFEFDTDMGSVSCGLFAIVYRYCIREDENPQLNQGVVGAFVLTRTLSRITVPAYCSAIVLNCKSILIHTCTGCGRLTPNTPFLLTVPLLVDSYRWGSSGIL
jgi:hypothetical protein